MRQKLGKSLNVLYYCLNKNIKGGTSKVRLTFSVLKDSIYILASNLQIEKTNFVAMSSFPGRYSSEYNYLSGHFKSCQG